MIKQIGLLLRSHPILLITFMITDKIGLQSVLHVLQYTIIKRPLSHIEKRIDDIMKTKFVKL